MGSVEECENINEKENDPGFASQPGQTFKMMVP
jgi:hypothetical protein